MLKKKTLMRKKAPARRSAPAASPTEDAATEVAEAPEEEAPAEEAPQEEAEAEGSEAEDESDEPAEGEDQPEHAEGEAPRRAVSKFDLAGSPERGRARIYEIAGEMGRVWGTHTAMPMNMAPVVNIQRMPIGILEFDYMTGGGIILGRNNRITGKKDTLKSTMCLRALRAAQRTCRHCKWRLVADPETGVINCKCPAVRFWIAHEDDYAWLPPEGAIRLYHGLLPDGATKSGQKFQLMCDPPPHLVGKKGMKRRPILFAEMERCEPMRCAFADTEGTIDAKWATANGIDPGLVLLIGGTWAEQRLEAVERTMLTRAFDFVCIDSTSMMETREMLEERQAGDRGTPAGKQRVMGDFIKRVVAAQSEEGLAGRYRPTLLTTSHLTQKGIGHGKHPYLGATDGNTVEHGVAMDIQMKADEFVFNKEKKVALYGKFTFVIVKNHCGGMGSTKTQGSIKFWLVETDKHPVGDSNDLETVISYARRLGDPFISPGRGAVKLVLHSPMISGQRKPFSTLGKLVDYLSENEGVYDDLRSRLLDKLIADRVTLTLVGGAEADEEGAARADGSN